MKETNVISDKAISIPSKRPPVDHKSTAAMVIKLSFACSDYDRMKAIEDGRVRPEGIDLTFLNYRVEET